MQTTLLGFGIAIILALVTALVGPLFIDWGSYRGEFEARASRLTGLDFRVTGPIDARLLPTPSLMLQGIEFGRQDQAGKVRARSLRLEFALGALVRGQWRIADARLEGPDFAVGLDRAGRLAWPVPKMGFDPEGVSIERLTIENGRAILTDAASGSRLVLDKLEFKGDMRSLAGPVKGGGSVVVAGQHYPYRVATGRIGDDGAMKVRLAVDPIDRPMTAEADLSIWIERGTPRFEGNVQFARAVGRAPADAATLITEPWRFTSKVKGDGASAVLEQIEFQYGPDDRAIKLKGNANVAFGPQPEISGALTSTQIDLDRVLAIPEAERRRPIVALRTLTQSLPGTFGLRVPTTLSIAVESVTLGGATLARVSGTVKADVGGVDINGLEFRAPGATQVRLTGRLDARPAGAQFVGSTSIEANDPRAFVAWLTERGDAPAVAAGQLRVGGDVTLGAASITIDQLKLELDRMAVTGRFTYAWASDSRPARLDAALAAPEIDLDRVQAFAKAVLGDAAFDWPREGALSFKTGRAVLAGVEAKRADVDVRIDANGLEIEQLAIADFGGAALAVKGRINTKAQSPRGAVTLDLDARSLDGVTALVERFAPQAADRIRRSAARITPLTLRASLAVDPAAAGGAGANAKFKVDGRAGTFRIALQGDSVAASDAFSIDNLAALGAAKVSLTGRFDGDDGGALVEMIGLDRFVAVEKRPGRLTFSAKGPLDGELAVDGQFGAGALAVSANGTVRISDPANPTVALNLKVANASVRSPRSVAPGRLAELLPASMAGRLAWAEGTLRFTDVTGTVAGTSVAGRLAVGMQQQPFTVEGDLDVSAVDLPAAIAVGLGIPAQTTGPSTAPGVLGPWPAEPFEQGFGRLNGHIAVKSPRVTLTPKLVARDVRGVLHVGESQLALQVSDGNLAGGRIAGELVFLREGEALIARTRFRLAGGSSADLLPGDGLPAGRLTLDISAEGTGMSPIALVGSLEGSGSFTLENARLARLDPGAFDSVIRAVDQGLPIDAIRVRDKMDAALAGGGLSVALAEGAISISAGQARLSNTMVRAQGADLAVAGGVNLSDGMLDARLAFSGGPAPSAPGDTRPEVLIALKGPVNTPKRTIDVAALSSWLALRAVDQQSKKLDMLEGLSKKLDLLEGREPAALPASPPSAPPAPDVPTGSAPIQNVPAAAPAPVVPAAPATVLIEPEPPRARPAVPAPPKPKPPGPTAEHVPPPIDIRPAPAPAPRGPRQPGAIGSPGAARAAPPPAAPRSLSEILFGR